MIDQPDEPGRPDPSASARRASREPGADASGTGAPSERGGIVALIRRHPAAWLAAALTVGFVLLGSGAVLAGAAVGGARETTAAAPAPSPTATSAEPEEELPRAVPESIAAASRLRTCSVAGYTSADAIQTLYGSVVNVDTGEALLDREAGSAQPTGSVMKLLMASAVLAQFGPDHTFQTRVVQGATPGAIVLVGGGDPTLSRLPEGQQPYAFRNAPKLSDLAAQVRASVPADQPITELILDATLWDAAGGWNPNWDRTDEPAYGLATRGYATPSTALMVDGGRANPQALVSERTLDPVAQAGEFFQQALAAQGIQVGSVSTGEAPDGAAVLAEVSSQSTGTLITQLMSPSDNVVSDALARQVAIAQGLDGSWSSLQTAIPSALRGYGVDTSALKVDDGSGLSRQNGVPTSYVTQLMAKMIQREQNLGIVYDAMPTAGGNMPSDRFTGEAADARGSVRAKSGWIEPVRALAGHITATDGSNLAFAFFSVGGDDASRNVAIDALTAAVYRCGDNLSNN